MVRPGAAFPFNLLEVRSGSGLAGRIELVVRILLFLAAILIWFPWRLLRRSVRPMRHYRERRRRRREPRPGPKSGEPTVPPVPDAPTNVEESPPV